MGVDRLGSIGREQLPYVMQRTSPICGRGMHRAAG